MRYLRFRRQLDEIHAVTPIDEVAFEEVRRHLGVDAAHAYGGFMAQLTAWCEEHGVPYSGVPVGEIKKFATSKGNASKGEMIAATQERSEEHTSELQSLMRISYAVFCLKKKTITTNNTN